jgi:aminopeptidase N/puromycin-sensitive aminopeptidase
VNVYLRRFSYGNATAEDFWSALAAASGRPVDKIMPTFVDQAGEPLLTVKSSCTAPPVVKAPPARKGKRSRRKPIQPHPMTQVSVSQQRFWANPADALKKEQTWMVPVCLKSGGAKPFCQILSLKEQTLPLTGCSPWVFVNGNAAGYYRTQYDKADLQKLISIAATELTTAERISLLRDQSALVGSGQQSMGTYLDLLQAVSQDAQHAMVETYLPTLGYVNDYVLPGTDATAFRAWVRSSFGPMMAKIGWTPNASESPDTHMLRGDLVHILGVVGEDPETIRQANSLAQQYLKDPNSVDASIAKEVLTVAARFGDEELFQQYVSAMRRMHAPEQFYNVSGTLAYFRDPKIVEKVLELAVSDEVRNQDAAGLIAGTLINTDGEKTAWEWVKAHWSAVEKKITMSSGSEIVNSTRRFCSAEMKDDVQQFFTEHKVPSSERALKQSREDIEGCVRRRPRLQTELAQWLQQHSGASSTGGQ